MWRSPCVRRYRVLCSCGLGQPVGSHRSWRDTEPSSWAISCDSVAECSSLRIPKKARIVEGVTRCSKRRGAAPEWDDYGKSPECSR